MQNCSSVMFGTLQLSVEQLMGNLRKMISFLSENLPGGWTNVRSAYVAQEGSARLPIYVSFGR